MYQNFGARAAGSSVEFRLFFPDAAIDPGQYARGGLPRIRSIRATGDFQPVMGNPAWNLASAPVMSANPHPNGTVYCRTVGGLPDGFYQYKYFVEFENGTTRWCGDPCSRYGGAEEENSGFVIGGNAAAVQPISSRLPLKDLVIYELMLDDFTAEFRASAAPLDAVLRKLDYLQSLGINAIEFMPWTAWPGEGFSWGYDPYAFFSVEHRYYNDPAAPADKLFRLQRLINELHARGIHVIMDGVFNHARVDEEPGRGFGYHWLYQSPAESPYLGSFAGGGYFKDFDFANECTVEFIVDVCKYWIDEYKIDGIRFDYALGYLAEGAHPAGIARVIQDLNAYCAAQSLSNMSFTLELLTDNRYEAIGKTNAIGAAGCWFDPLMWQGFDAVGSGNVSSSLVRALNTGKDFEPGRRPVTYVENHDHSTLAEHCGGRNVWWRSQPLAIALLTCCGAPLIHNGQEWGEQYWFPEEGNGRVQPRPLRWNQLDDFAGTTLYGLYRKLIAIRKAHPALRSRNFYPEPYDERDTRFNAEGYGIDESRDIAIFHRWGTDETGRLERFIVVLNFSAYEQTVDIPFSVNGPWEDLLNGGTAQVTGFRLDNQKLSSHWGRIYCHVAA